jgi:hypothetical protein
MNLFDKIILGILVVLFIACGGGGGGGGDDDDGGDDDGGDDDGDDYSSCDEACDHAVNCFSSSVNDALKSRSGESMQLLPCLQDGSCLVEAIIDSLPDDAIEEENGKCLEYCFMYADEYETDCIFSSSCGEIVDDITQCGTMSDFVHGMIERNGIVVE